MAIPITDFKARLYDGETAAARGATFRLVPGAIEIRGDDRQPIGTWPFDAISVTGSLGDDAAVTLSCSHSPTARLRIEDKYAVAAVMARLPGSARTDKPRPKRIALWIAVGVAVVGLAVFIVDRLPALAAPLLPFEIKRALGDAVAQSMFPAGESRVAAGALDRLGERLRRAAGIEQPLKIIVADHPMVNAFAAPGGVVVLTCGLIKGAEDPDEVAGVLAHEICHDRHDNTTQRVLRSIGISALLQLLTGGSDLSGLANAGGTLAYLSYSRAAEEEADSSAIDILATAGIHADGLSRFFSRLEDKEDKGKTIAGLIPSWLSTHPPTEARREATARGVAGAPATSAAEWQEVRALCGAKD